MVDTPHSPRAFVIGSPIKHSRSPIIHRHWLAQAGLIGRYDPVDVTPENLPVFIETVKDERSGFVGGNITIPHKESVLELVDEIDDTARKIGAVNTIWLENGVLKATNTDAIGFALNLDDRSSGWDQGKCAVVLGAGGASRAILYALKQRGFETVAIVNRTLARAETLAEQFGPEFSAYGLGDLNKCLQDADIFVNTSSLGMDGSPVPDIDFSRMPADSLVTDIVYTPLETPILALAKSAGLRMVDGLGMLLHQAAPGFEKWFGMKPKVTDELRQKIISDMEHR